jgi:glycosyltransferase involved in cell wall biosynthesis
MYPDSVSVTVSIGMSPYQAGLPRALQQHGMLRRAFRFGAHLEVLDPHGDGSLRRLRRFRSFRVANRVLWGSWSRLPGTARSRLPQVASSWLADHLIAPYVPACSIFHGITTLSCASLLAARRKGALTLVESTVQHPLHWQRTVLEECARFGVRPRRCDDVLPHSLIQRILREYELCDAIVVRSSLVRRRFEEFFYGDKVAVVLAGVDHEFFAPAPTPPGIFRVCYAGRVEVAKGVPYLLQAWNRLRLENAELVLMGEVRPEMRDYVRQHAGPSVKVLGRMPPGQVAQHYRQASLFVLPSVNEGLARVMLEAMASGLPVVATEESGAEDCVADRSTGFIVPARNVDALADTLLWCSGHPDEIRAMGIAGRAAVVRNFTLEHYEQRQIALYRSLARQRGAGSAVSLS